MGKILIVDDAGFVRIRLKNVLKPLGHDIIEASTGAEGIEKFKQESPQLVFLDVNMPEMDGITALKEIVGINKEAKVIMLTNDSQQKTIMDALQSGAKNFLAKPFDEEKLIGMVKKYVDGIS